MRRITLTHAVSLLAIISIFGAVTSFANEHKNEQEKIDKRLSDLRSTISGRYSNSLNEALTVQKRRLEDIATVRKFIDAQRADGSDDKTRVKSLVSRLSNDEKAAFNRLFSKDGDLKKVGAISSTVISSQGTIDNPQVKIENLEQALAKGTEKINSDKDGIEDSLMSAKFYLNAKELGLTDDDVRRLVKNIAKDLEVEIQGPAPASTDARECVITETVIAKYLDEKLAELIKSSCSASSGQ